MDFVWAVARRNREEELTGRTRRELECPDLLGDYLKGRDVEWDGIDLDDRWWDAPPETEKVAQERVHRVCQRMLALPQETGVAVVCHSYWLKVAVPFSSRPKGSPSPIGCAAAYWPQNAVPYIGEFIPNSTQLQVVRKFFAEDVGAETAAELRTALEPRRVLLLRHGISEAQQRRRDRKEKERDIKKFGRSRSRSPRSNGAGA